MPVEAAATSVPAKDELVLVPTRQFNRIVCVRHSDADRDQFERCAVQAMSQMGLPSYRWKPCDTHTTEVEAMPGVETKHPRLRLTFGFSEDGKDEPTLLHIEDADGASLPLDTPFALINTNGDMECYTDIGMYGSGGWVYHFTSWSGKYDPVLLTPYTDHYGPERFSFVVMSRLDEEAATTVLK